MVTSTYLWLYDLEWREQMNVIKMKPRVEKTTSCLLKDYLVQNCKLGQEFTSYSLAEKLGRSNVAIGGTLNRLVKIGLAEVRADRVPDHKHPVYVYRLVADVSSVSVVFHKSPTLRQSGNSGPRKRLALYQPQQEPKLLSERLLELALEVEALEKKLGGKQ